jgi:hypothetical protein
MVLNYTELFNLTHLAKPNTALSFVSVSGIGWSVAWFGLDEAV